MLQQFKWNHLFVLLLFIVIFLCIHFGRYSSYVIFTRTTDPQSLRARKNLLNILMWTKSDTEPFVFFHQGRKSFIDSGCEYNNCYITSDRSYLEDETAWDAILFHAPEFTWSDRVQSFGFPKKRHKRQKYIFVCIESAANYPVCQSTWNNFFNWTMTYRLDSDVPWTYVTVTDRDAAAVIGPTKEAVWSKDSGSISEELKVRLMKKSKAVVWFVSNCETLSKREMYAKTLEKRLNENGLELDIYGQCGTLNCETRDNQCFKHIEDYRFYLAFENSFSEDYVTEKLLHATQNIAVPIVWGGANYSRFLRPGAYLDARTMTPTTLASRIRHLIDDHYDYYDMFRWRTWYDMRSSYDSPISNPFCRLCSALNGKMFNTTTIYEDFQSWWNDADANC